MMIIRDHFDNCESASLRAAYKRHFKELMPTIKEPKGRKAGVIVAQWWLIGWSLANR